MTWQQFNALCARRMHVYAVVDVLETCFGWRGETYIVDNNEIRSYQQSETVDSPLDALRAGLRALPNRAETETGGWRE